MNITIRKGVAEDFSQVVELIKEFSIFQRTPEKVTITAEQMKHEEKLFQCFVAVDQSQLVVGFGSYFFAYYSWSGKAIYLDDLYVSEAYRGLGIGTRLLNSVIELAAIENCKKVR